MRKWFIAVLAAMLMVAGLTAVPGSAAGDLRQQAVGGFTDVPAGIWYEQAVKWAEGADVTTGTSPTTFSPDLVLDRRDGVTLLWRANGSPGGNPDAGFGDVADGKYYTEAVNWAKATGVTTGISPTEFGATDPMTRAMYVTMLWRAAGSPGGNPDAGFGDVADGKYYTEAVNWAKAKGITTGIAPGQFGPDVALTRAMGVTFLWRVAGAPVFSLNIFHINDHHSNLEGDDIDIAVGSGEVEIELGGFPRVVSIIDYLQGENAGENNVTVHAGDAITGTLYYTLFGGEADAALMNEVCFDVFALGNHEFDAGDDGLAEFLGYLETPGCDTPVLAANVVPQLGTPLFPDPGTKLIQPYHIEHFNGDAVAFVGIDIAQKTQVSSQPFDTTAFLDEVTTAQNQINMLTAMGYDKIGLVTHQGYGNDIDLASMVSGVDFIVGGDSHTLVGDHSALGIGGTGDYPTITTDLSGNTTCIVQAWEYSKVVGNLNVQFDADGNVVSCGGHAYFTFGEVTEFDEDGDGTAATQAEVDAALAAAHQMQWDADTDAQAVLDTFSADVDVLSQQVIGTATEDICVGRFPNDGRDGGLCGGVTPFGGEIQQVVTHAFLARAFRADIALQNSGGVRINIPAGDVTIADAYTLLPFANTLVELEMTGAEVKLALEQGLSNTVDSGGSSGAFPYGSGIRWDLDVNQAFGDRFSNIEVRRQGEADFSPLDPTATYIVVANSFMVGGGDGYFVLADVADDGRATDTGLDYAQSFIDWVEQDKGGSFGKPTEYSLKSYVPLAP